jgi:hypothetical protein
VVALAFGVEAAVRARLDEAMALHARQMGRQRLEQVRDDELSYRLPKPQPDECTELRLTPLELIDRLAGLIPPPPITCLCSAK